MVAGSIETTAPEAAPVHLSPLNGIPIEHTQDRSEVADVAIRSASLTEPVPDLVEGVDVCCAKRQVVESTPTEHRHLLGVLLVAVDLEDIEFRARSDGQDAEPGPARLHMIDFDLRPEHGDVEADEAIHVACEDCDVIEAVGQHVLSYPRCASEELPRSYKRGAQHHRAAKTNFPLDLGRVERAVCRGRTDNTRGGWHAPSSTAAADAASIDEAWYEPKTHTSMPLVREITADQSALITDCGDQPSSRRHRPRHPAWDAERAGVVTLASSQLRILRWAIWTTTIVVAISFTGGVVAAALGGPFTELGSGAGGLYAVPSLVLDLTAVAIGVPASVIVARHLRTEPRSLRAAVIAGGGLWIIAIGYFLIAHWIDPCINGCGAQRAGSDRSLVAPTSRSARPASFRPEIDIAGDRTRVLVEQLGAVDATRLGDFATHISSEELWGIDEALVTVLGLR